MTGPLPAGPWPISVLYPWATVSRETLHCARCGTASKAPSPGVLGYGAVIEVFLAQHKGCAETTEGGEAR